MNTLRDDSLDPIQDIFQQFEQQAHSEEYSSSHSRSGTSDDEETYAPEIMAFLGMEGLAAQSISTVHQQDHNNVYGTSFEPYTDNGLSPHSALSSNNNNNASGSSPEYSSYGSGGGASFDQQQQQQNGGGFPTNAYSSTSNPGSFASYPVQYASALPPQHQHQYPNSGFPTSQPQQANALISPPSSAASSNAGFNNGATNSTSGATSSSFVHNEALSRMIADAQAQSNSVGGGQAPSQSQSQSQMQQTQSQAAYASYLSTLNPATRQQYGNPAYNNNNNNQDGGAIFTPSFPVPEYGSRPDNSSDTETPKRRKVDLSSPVAISASGRGISFRSAKSGHQPHGSPLQYVQPMAVNAREDLQNFSFDVKPGMVEGSLGAPPQLRSSMGLIANAGISDSRHMYTDENLQDPPSIRGAQRSRSQAPSALPVKGLRAERKVEKPKKDKRKKGDKGHNAVERRYRNNINNAIATLRDIVPALRHLKPLPSMPASRRRASQFTLSTAAQAPTPAGLIDGIPAAKTLSKGTILGKSIEYIQYLQGSRIDAGEDIEIFKTVVLELVAGGATLIETFEQRRATREVEREKARDIAREEQALLDEEDNSDEDEDEDEDGPVPTKAESNQAQRAQTKANQQQDQARRLASVSNLDGLAQLRLHLANGGTPATLPNSVSSQYANAMSQQSRSSPGGLPPSPVSSSEDLNHSPKFGSPTTVYRTTPQQQPRVLLASFFGLSFVGGLGYDWTYGSGAAADPSQAAGARAWAGGLVRSAGLEVVANRIAPSALATGLMFFGIASVLACILFLVYPFVAPPSREERLRRRADALASLVELNNSMSDAVSYGSECGAALNARKELLKLVGAPTYALVPALVKEAVAIHWRRELPFIGVGDFSSWSEEERIECAVAWVRIAEIEITTGFEAVSWLSRCYTFCRLFNLARSSSWPTSTPSTSRTAVDAILALHLAGLHRDYAFANSMWQRAARLDQKKEELPLQPWVAIALSNSFDRALEILETPRSERDWATPSDTLPLLRIAEEQCEGALREAWVKIFVAVVQTTCPPGSSRSPANLFPVLVDQSLLDESIAHVISSTIVGTSVHTLARVTRALCSFYTGDEDHARTTALELAHEARNEGPMARLGCAAAFFSLILDDEDLVDEQDAIGEVDVVAAATLGWLSLCRQQSEIVLSDPSANANANVNAEEVEVEGKVDMQLHEDTLAVRRLLAASLFKDPALISMCALPAREKGVDRIQEMDLPRAHEALNDALTNMGRRAIGLGVDESDSGIDV